MKHNMVSLQYVSQLYCQWGCTFLLSFNLLYLLFLSQQMDEERWFHHTFMVVYVVLTTSHSRWPRSLTSNLQLTVGHLPSHRTTHSRVVTLSYSSKGGRINLATVERHLEQYNFQNKEPMDVRNMEGQNVVFKTLQSSHSVINEWYIYIWFLFVVWKFSNQGKPHILWHAPLTISLFAIWSYVRSQHALVWRGSLTERSGLVLSELESVTIDKEVGRGRAFYNKLQHCLFQHLCHVVHQPYW